MSWWSIFNNSMKHLLSSISFLNIVKQSFWLGTYPKQIKVSLLRDCFILIVYYCCSMLSGVLSHTVLGSFTNYLRSSVYIIVYNFNPFWGVLFYSCYNWADGLSYFFLIWSRLSFSDVTIGIMRIATFIDDDALENMEKNIENVLYYVWK